MEAKEIVDKLVDGLTEQAKNSVHYFKPPRKAILIRKDGFKQEIFFEGLPPTYRIPKKKDIQVFMVATEYTPTVSQDYIEFYRADFNEDVKIYKEL